MAARVPILARANAVVCRGAQEAFRVDPVKVVDAWWLAQVREVEGREPFCDACGRFIVAGDKIRTVWLRDPGSHGKNKRERRVHHDCLRRGG